MLTYDLLKKYERDGFIVLKKAMLKNECKKLIKKTIVPILHKKQIYLSKSESWKNKDNTKKHGQLIYGPKGGHIISKNNKHYRFPALFQSKKLNNILNIIHSRNEKGSNKCVHEKLRQTNYRPRFLHKKTCPSVNFSKK